MAKIATVWFTPKGESVAYLRIKGKLYKTEVKVPRYALASGGKLAKDLKAKLIEEAIRADLGCGVLVADDKGFQHNGVRFQYGK